MGYTRVQGIGNDKKSMKAALSSFCLALRNKYFFTSILTFLNTGCVCTFSPKGCLTNSDPTT